MRRKRGKRPQTSMLFVLVLLLFVPLAKGLVITPHSTVLDEFSTTQEVVVTFYNDQFEPLGCQPTPSYLSSYMGEYITVEPNKFLIEHDEQVNVRITTNFPETMTPQEHELVLQAYEGADEEFIITFRPPGEQQVGLLLQEFHSDESEYGEAVTATVNMKNTGNTVLFVTPQIFIKQAGVIVKNTTYQRPIIIHPNEVYPLTLRQDNSDLEPGEYVGIVQVLYKSDGSTRITDEEVFTFMVVERRAEAVASDWWIIIAVIGSVAIVAGGIVWLVPAVTRHQHRRKKFVERKKEKHITKPDDKLQDAWHDVYVLRKELAALSEEARSFVEESEHWLRQHQRGE